MFTNFSVDYSPLDFLSANTKGIISAIRNKDEQIIKKLLAMGIYIGMPITLEQTFPSFIISVGQTRVAIDHNIARSIKVKITDENN